jgi:YD repeat-containing protein
MDIAARCGPKTWQYNGNRLLASATQPESGTTTFGYDAAGRLVTTSDARGVTSRRGTTRAAGSS